MINKMVKSQSTVQVESRVDSYSCNKEPSTCSDKNTECIALINKKSLIGKIPQQRIKLHPELNFIFHAKCVN